MRFRAATVGLSRGAPMCHNPEMLSVDLVIVAIHVLDQNEFEMLSSKHMVAGSLSGRLDLGTTM